MASTDVSATAAAGFDLRALTRRTLVRRPESWVYAVAAGAALVLLLSAALPSGAASAHVHHHGASPKVASGVGQLLDEWGGWMLMVLAMMLPVVAPDAQRVAMRSLWHRRHRAITCFLAGYLAVWAVLGACFVVVAVVAARVYEGPGVAAAALVAAAAWQVSRPRRRVMRRCGSLRPSAIRGWQADRGCAISGSLVGLRCAFTCGPVMLAMAVGHSLLLMAGLTALLLSERARGPNPDRRAGRPLEAWLLLSYAGIIAAASLG